MHRINELFAFVAEGETGEGVIAFQTPERWLPMIGPDWEKIKEMIPIAEELSKEHGKPFKLLKFTQREEVDYKQNLI